MINGTFMLDIARFLDERNEKNGPPPGQATRNHAGRQMKSRPPGVLLIGFSPGFHPDMVG
jgi:hypothetical protein